MRGKISFYDEELGLVGEASNLVTDSGKNQILRYLARMSSDYAGAMSIGLEGTDADATDVRLGVETLRIPVIMRSIDYSGQEITFKGMIDPAFAGKIYEIGLMSQSSDEVTGSYSSKILTSFEPYEVWTTTTSGTVTETDPYSFAESRIGTEYKWATISTNSGYIIYTASKNIDLGGYSDSDQVCFGHISYSNRLTSLTVTFTDLLGYTASYVQAVTTHTAGDNTAQYNIYKVEKSSFTLSDAAFDWSSIVSISVKTIGSGSAGTSPNGVGAWDFVGMIDTDALNPNVVLVSHSADGSLLATKAAGKTMDIEYKLGFNL